MTTTAKSKIVLAIPAAKRALLSFIHWGCGANDNVQYLDGFL
jgi:hypothetical protein